VNFEKEERKIEGESMKSDYEMESKGKSSLRICPSRFVCCLHLKLMSIDDKDENSNKDINYTIRKQNRYIYICKH